MNPAGKTILVIGGAGIGVGAGECQAVQQAGGRLVINDLKQADVDRTAARCEEAIPLATVAYEATPQDYDRLLSIDLPAVWLMSKAFVLHLQPLEIRRDRREYIAQSLHVGLLIVRET